MKKSIQQFQKITEITNGKLVGGFSGALNKFGGNSLMDNNKNEGQCTVSNNCVAGANCAKSCHIFPTS